LRGDAQAVAGLAHAAFQDRADLKLAADLGDALAGRLVLHDRGARDHGQIMKPRQLGDQLLGHAVGEVFILGIGADVGERQHRDTVLVQRRLRRDRG
jgi:hypothetical protein